MKSRIEIKAGLPVVSYQCETQAGARELEALLDVAGVPCGHADLIASWGHYKLLVHADYTSEADQIYSSRDRW